MEFLMQPINRLYLVEQQNSARGQPEQHPTSPLHYPVMTPSVVEASSADTQLCAPEAAAGAGSAEKPQGPENSIEQVDPRTPGCTKRVPIGAAALVRAPFPDRISALETTIRKFGEQPVDIVIVPR